MPLYVLLSDFVVVIAPPGRGDVVMDLTTYLREGSSCEVPCVALRCLFGQFLQFSVLFFDQFCCRFEFVCLCVSSQGWLRAELLARLVGSGIQNLFFCDACAGSLHVGGSYSAKVPRSSLAEVHREFVHHILEDEVDGQKEGQGDKREDGEEEEENGVVEERTIRRNDHNAHEAWM